MVEANTVAVPVSWELFEPQEGNFQESFVTDIIRGARENGLRLILLWFGTWKNGTMEYVPGWVKKDMLRFPRAQCKDGSRTHNLSPHCKRNLEADKKAFCRLMETVKAFDLDENTVIGIQIENEAGLHSATRRDFSEFGEKAFKEDVPEELYREFLSDISDEIDRESKIIDDLLTLVKADKSNAELNVEQININGLLEQILKRLRPIAKKRNIELVLESIREVSADVDEVKLSLALSNLVENAVKYNHEEGWVHVTLDADHKYFYIKVADTGIGIPEDALEHIFERFFRVDKARSRESGGTGLGLSIAKEIIDRHEGTIELVDRSGPGLTVRITLLVEGPHHGRE